MSNFSKLIRFAALLLLLSAAVDLIAVDMLGAFWQDQKIVQAETQGSCVQDDCFCCSGIAVPSTPTVVLVPSPLITPTYQPVELVVLSLSPSPLLRPPRA